MALPWCCRGAQPPLCAGRRWCVCTDCRHRLQTRAASRLPLRRFPRAARLLPALGAVPVLIIGAGANRGCVPAAAGYHSFFDQAGCVGPGPRAVPVVRSALRSLIHCRLLSLAACARSAPAALLLLPEAGHFSFLGAASRQLLQQAVCPTGRADPARVQAAAVAATVAFAVHGRLPEGLEGICSAQGLAHELRLRL